MVSTTEGVKLIAAETARLKEYLRGAGPEERNLDSPCEGWTVGDFIGHLGWAADFVAAAFSPGKSGVPPAPAAPPAQPGRAAQDEPKHPHRGHPNAVRSP